MTRTLPVTALLTAMLLLGACRPGTDAAPADPAPAPATPAGEAPAHAATGTDARLVSDETSPAGDPHFDARAFAGGFEGTLPCADCPGSDSRLELHPDGRYQQRDRERGGGASLEAGGTWTVEDGGGRLRLDPDDKGSQDRVYDIASNDELRLADVDGQPADAAVVTTFRRSGRP